MYIFDFKILNLLNVSGLKSKFLNSNGAMNWLCVWGGGEVKVKYF